MMIIEKEKVNLETTHVSDGPPLCQHGGCPFLTSKQPIALKQFTKGKQFFDTLHQRSKPIRCTPNACMGSLMAGQSHCLDSANPRSKDEIMENAKEFLEQYFIHLKNHKGEDLQHRLGEIEQDVNTRGTYMLTSDELHFGCKLAWRNASRCIGRIQWNRLELQDCRHITTTKEMFQALCHHLEYATNGGNIRSMITVFPQRVRNRQDFRLWNPQLISYAGYLQPDGTVIGDPAHVQFTRICQRLGWKSKNGKHDILPWVLESPSEGAVVYDIPEELVLRVKLEHPKYTWFAEMDLEWYALPAVANMLLDCGGLEFPAAPFNGWYLGTEVGARDLCDPQRFNIIEEVAKRMGLDTSSAVTLWKDQALVEVNVAVLYSYQKNHVTIVDHHTASDSFIKHMENEQRQRGGCPADWVWIVPPMSSSLTQVFHQEMLCYNLKPSYEYQESAWKSYKWPESNVKLKYRLFSIARCVLWMTSLLRTARSHRIPITLLYATETGKSETFARLLEKLLTISFSVRVVCMEDYNLAELPNEQLLIIITSTFGNGEAPDNGKKFWKYLCSLKQQSQFSLLSNVRYSVFALGSRQYPSFCAFGKNLNRLLSELGGNCLIDIGLGDEQSGQEQSFNAWAGELYKVICNNFQVELNEMMPPNALDDIAVIDPTNLKLVVLHDKKQNLTLSEELSNLHHKKVISCQLLSRAHLEARHSERQTLLVRLKMKSADVLEYEPGDHLGIFPMNPRDLVETLLDYFKNSDVGENDTVQMETLIGGKWQAVPKLPPCTLRTAFTYYLDIVTPPTPHLLNMLSKFTLDNWDKYRLKKLSEIINDYEEWRDHFCPTIVDVLNDFKSIHITPSFLLSQLPLLKPRYYSISSSRSVTPDEIHLTMGLVSYRIYGGKGPKRFGVCTNYIERFAKDEVPCFLRRAPQFRLPQNTAVPVIMVGAGSGIAPFRSFWKQREFEIEQNDSNAREFGKMVLFFGCRDCRVDNIYAYECSHLLRKGVLSMVFNAFSRETTKKRYVQHVIFEQSALIYQLVVEEGGHIYICGEATMAEGVKNALLDIFKKEGNMDKNKAEETMQQMKEEERIHEDIFSTLSHKK